MKKLVFSLLIVMATSSAAWAGSIRVYNSDSKDHTVEVECSGSSDTVEIRGSTTATYTFHSTSDSCEIVGGSVAFPTDALEDGQKWKIDGGEAEPS